MTLKFQMTVQKKIVYHLQVNSTDSASLVISHIINYDSHAQNSLNPKFQTEVNREKQVKPNEITFQ